MKKFFLWKIYFFHLSLFSKFIIQKMATRIVFKKDDGSSQDWPLLRPPKAKADDVFQLEFTSNVDDSNLVVFNSSDTAGDPAEPALIQIFTYNEGLTKVDNGDGTFTFTNSYSCKHSSSRSWLYNSCFDGPLAAGAIFLTRFYCTKY